MTVGDEIVASIERGLLLLVGVAGNDDQRDVESVASKVAGLRVFPDDEGKMNLSIGDIDGEVLVVSQFTLQADVRRGRRPSFTGAAHPETARGMVERFADELRGYGLPVETGVFGADMKVSLLNDGPVTLIVESQGGRIA